MALAPKLAALQADLAALAGAVSYRQLVDQLKAAIAVAQAGGLAAVSVALPTGSAITYPSIDAALRACEVLEALAAGEAGGVVSVKLRLA
jgi:hypothetical protein